MGFDDLAVVVADDIGAVAMQHARAARNQRRRVAAGLDAVARGFGADQAHAAIVEESMEDADGVAAAAHAGGDGVGQAAVVGQHLAPRLVANHRVEVTHQLRVRMRPGDGADDVEGVAHVGDPVAHGFVERVLERLAARMHRHHGRAQQLHAEDVGRLAFDVGGAHVNHALQAQARGHRGAGDAMLAGAGFGNDPGLAHAAGQHGLADGVVDLVRAGVVEVFALEQDARAAHVFGQPAGFVDRAGPAHVMFVFVLEFGLEGRVAPGRVVGGFKLAQRFDQGFGHEHAAVAAEVAGGIGEHIEVGDLRRLRVVSLGHCGLHVSPLPRIAACARHP